MNARYHFRERTQMIEGLFPRGALYGAYIFLRAVYTQVRKSHGSGRQPWCYILRTASMCRWLVHGQHRRTP